MTLMDTGLRCSSSPVRTAATPAAASVDDTAATRGDLGNGEPSTPAPCMPQAAAAAEEQEGEEQITVASAKLQTGTATVVPRHLFESAFLRSARQTEQGGERGGGGGGGVGPKDGSTSSASAPKPRPKHRPGPDSALSATTTVPARQVISPSARVDILHTLLATSASGVGGQHGRRSAPRVGSGRARAVVENRGKLEAEKSKHGEGESDRVGRLAATGWVVSEEEAAAAAAMGPDEREEGLRCGEQQQFDEAVTDALEHLVLSNSVNKATAGGSAVPGSVGGVGVVDGSLVRCTSTAGGVSEGRTRHDDDPRASAEGTMAARFVAEEDHRSILFRGGEEQNNKNIGLNDNLLRSTSRDNVSPSPSLKPSRRTSLLSPDLLMSKKKTHEITPVGHHAGASSPSPSIGGGRRRTRPGVTDDLFHPTAAASAGRPRDSGGSSGRVNNDDDSGALPAAASSYGNGDSDEGEGLALALNPPTSRRRGSYWRASNEAKRIGEVADDAEMDKDDAGQWSVAEELEVRGRVPAVLSCLVAGCCDFCSWLFRLYPRPPAPPRSRSHQTFV